MPINRYFLSDFVSVQRESFFQLLEKGLIEEFSKRNPIIHRKRDCSYYFYPEYYILTRPEYRPSEAIIKNKSYTSKLYVPVQITNKKEKKITLKWVYIGNLPLMTKRGHFILNGATRVIVNQILRSPGAYYQQKIYENYERENISKNKDDGAENSENQNDSNVFLQTENTYKRFYCDLICMRGTWLRIEMDKEKSIWVQMKRGPKIPIFWFLLAMGLSEKFLLKSIPDSEKLLGNLERNNGNTLTPRDLRSRGITNLNSPNEPRDQRSRGKKNKSGGPISEGNGGKTLETKKKYEEASFRKWGLSSKKTHNVIEDRESPTVYDKGSASPKNLPVIEDHGVKDSIDHPAIDENGAEQTSKKRNYPYLKNPPEAWESIYTLLHSKTKSTKSPHLENETHSAEAITKQTRETDSKHKFDENGVTRGSQTARSSRAGSTRSNIMSRVLPRKTTKSLTELGRQWLYNRFMNPRSYDLGKQGRIALNQKLGLNISSQQFTLTGLDLLYATDYLIKLDKGFYKVDDIDHLKNRRVRTSGELIQIQIGVGLVRLEKFLRYNDMKVEPTEETAIFGSAKPPRSLITALTGRVPYGHAGSSARVRETRANRESRKTLVRPDALPRSPRDFQLRGVGDRATISNRGEISRRLRGQFKSTLTSSRINSKAFNSAIREFFGTSPLSQFMDQINPLAELTHKRRLSSMGPGGVTRDTATLAIRGIHPTHYGRICPIETPEGKNTGLVNSMTTYARVNYAGLLESPFYKVYKGQVQKNTGMYFLTAEQEEKIKLAAADLFVSRIGFLPKSMIPVRIAETFTKIDRKSVQFIGVSPLQMISIAASLIPFLEHDDANRALMGSNMQRQAVPLIRPQRPIVGTGLEGKAVSDSGHVVQTKKSGLITYVSSKKILVSEPRVQS